MKSYLIEKCLFTFIFFVAKTPPTSIHTDSLPSHRHTLWLKSQRTIYQKTSKILTKKYLHMYALLK